MSRFHQRIEELLQDPVFAAAFAAATAALAEPEAEEDLTMCCCNCPCCQPPEPPSWTPTRAPTVPRCAHCGQEMMTVSEWRQTSPTTWQTVPVWRCFCIGVPPLPHVAPTSVSGHPTLQILEGGS